LELKCGKPKFFSSYDGEILLAQQQVELIIMMRVEF
jgi:hypothetical protein